MSEKVKERACCVVLCCVCSTEEEFVDQEKSHGHIESDVLTQFKLSLICIFFFEKIFEKELFLRDGNSSDFGLNVERAHLGHGDEYFHFTIDIHK